MSEFKFLHCPSCMAHFHEPHCEFYEEVCGYFNHCEEYQQKLTCEHNGAPVYRMKEVAR